MRSVLFCSVLTSCSKEGGTLLNTRENPSEFLKTNADLYDLSVTPSLNSIALALVELSKDQAFRQLVYDECNKQFDKDYNVLLKDLELVYDAGYEITFMEKLKQSFLTYSSQSIYHGNNENLLLVSGDEFKNAVRGVSVNSRATFYTQIYIPFINKISMDEEPIIAIAFDETADCTTLAYKIIDGEVSIITVSEDFAKEHLVWVISINESVDNNGNLLSDINNPFFEDIGHTGVPVCSGKRVRVDEIKVNDKKECWLCGKAELSIIGLQVESCDSGEPPLFGRDFYKLKTNELDEWIDISNDLSAIALQENPLEFGEFVGFIFYERDRNSSNNERDWTIGNCEGSQITTVYYYSRQTPYGSTGIGVYGYGAFQDSEEWIQFPVNFEWLGTELRLESVNL